MSGEYVICKADASPILQWPGGIAILTIRAGRRYSTEEAVVKQHPELFTALEPRRGQGGGMSSRASRPRQFLPPSDFSPIGL